MDASPDVDFIDRALDGATATLERCVHEVKTVPYSSIDSSVVTRHKRKLQDLLGFVTGLAGEESSERREGLTFVSFAGEERSFVEEHLLKAIEGASVPTFYDDDMPLGTSSEVEMAKSAEETGQAVLVLSRAFLTKMWPMKELHIFMESSLSPKTRILPLYYGITPDQLQDEVIPAFDR